MDQTPDAVPLLAVALGIGADGVKAEEDEVVNPLDMEVDDDDDLLVSLRFVFKGESTTCHDLELTFSSTRRFRKKLRTKKSQSPNSTCLHPVPSRRARRRSW